MDLLYMRNLSKHELRLIADMRGVKIEKALKKDELFEILRKYDKITYNESPFKSMISDIRSILPKKGFKTIKKGFKYAEEIKELTSLQIENFKNNLIKIRNDSQKNLKRIIE